MNERGHMSNHRKQKSDFDRKLQQEAKAHEPMFWLIPEWLQIIKPMDVATRIELLELELEVRQIERLARSEKTGWLQDPLYRLARYARLYIWVFLMNILGVVLIVAVNVLWFWLLGYLIYWAFTS